MQPVPARVGDALDAIDTPALCVDLDAFERNLVAMADATRGIRLRPHAKAHKCPDIARAQIARGAVGVCCQKTDEAAAFVAAGIRDVLVTNEVVAPTKIARLAALARDAAIGVLVDSHAIVPLLSEAATSTGVTLDAYVEIDVGANRCGVLPGTPAVALGQAIAKAPGLRFRGLQAYQGTAQHLRTPQEREAAISTAIAQARATRDAIVRAGIACDIVTGAGTGTWPLERASGVYDELQPGSYVFMDVDYGRNTLGAGELRFEQSLFVIASVMSVPSPQRAIVDAGLKAFSVDAGLPIVHGAGGLEYRKATDEHGVIAVAEGSRVPTLGERVWLVPGHCDPTVNLYDWIVAFRGDAVEAVWSIPARGALG
ncbi:MAG TPA: DSD1 family PLP-dependent enzyme [Casimicrobiaceae bacterium]